jgi:hypothetical protein
MTALIAFILGWLFKAIFSATIGQVLIVPMTKVALEEISQLPRVIHYLSEHDGKSFNCDLCRLGHPNQVDSIN